VDPVAEPREGCGGVGGGTPLSAVMEGWFQVCVQEGATSFFYRPKLKKRVRD